MNNDQRDFCIELLVRKVTLAAFIQVHQVHVGFCLSGGPWTICSISMQILLIPLKRRKLFLYGLMLGILISNLNKI